jgi:hypothetical protein
MTLRYRLCMPLAAIACAMPVAQAAAAPVLAQATAKILPEPKPGSNYLQCDGAPNNMTAGETTARLIGAVTLLALFAPPPESYDASKRKLAAEGVAACSALIDGEKKEGNPARRVQLILARAIHRIEAKDYQAALDDVKIAEAEASAAGLTANPYFARSQGRALGMIRSAALFRLGRPEDAQAASLDGTATIRQSTALNWVPDYTVYVRNGAPAEEQLLHWRTLNHLMYSRAEAARLEELGRFTEAAALRDAMMGYNAKTTTKGRNSLLIAEAALSHALGGDMTGATKLAADAHANFDKNTADGNPDSSGSEYVEVMDLLTIVTTAQTDLKAARRLFAGRSAWPSASLGSVIEVDRRLRTGASADELIGSLAKTPEQMLTERADAARAAALTSDGDNKTLWRLLPRTIGASSYEAVSKRAWNTKKSPLLVPIDPKKPRSYDILALSYGDPVVERDAFKLHAALLAKARGQQGFAILQIYNDSTDYVSAVILTGNRGDPGLAAPIFNDADAVIADLSTIIPSPEVLTARKDKH